MNDYSEDALVEQPAIALFAALGYATANCFHERFGERATLGRETSAEVVLRPRLRAALVRLNPGLPAEALDAAIDELTRDRSALSPAHANRDVYRSLKDGVKVRVRAAAGRDEETDETVRVIDWRDPANNDFFLASQFWVSGDIYKRRPDLVGFVNGLPLLLVELKATARRLEDAYDDNLTDYRETIPQLFWYNALIVLSNGSQTRVGSLTATWEHFTEWKKVAGEDERGAVSLETVIRGVCAPARLLDLVENFTLFSDAGGRLVKLVARNHQYLGVNNAVAALGRRDANGGRLGVFWHTQGSGKSYSMAFFAQKVLRTLPGAWTFLLVTDRQELDEQIYTTFAGAGLVTEPEHQVHARGRRHLKALLGENHRMLFTLIQKFHTAAGKRHPVLSDRHDIIVITDEAHRSQYDTFALNLRNALPNAAFIGFTGTPLLAGEEKTREVFGDYVSIYNFRQSVEDGATVPLYYENRIPALQLTNPQFDADLEALIDAAGLDEAREARLERELGHQYHLITRDDRLDAIAADIVTHFVARSLAGGGKALVVSIDKATAVTMYDKVRRHWQDRLAALRAQLATATGAAHDALASEIAFMTETDLAVVVSASQHEARDFKRRGLDIAPHRRRMIREDLETKFKDAADPLRLVFVCAMWLTGFDVPSLSTVYLDKPLRNHTLMQAIARANRVCGAKNHGLVVDYIGVFRDLQHALAIYGASRTGTTDDLPVKDKAELVAALREAVDAVTAHCRACGVDPVTLVTAITSGGQDFARLCLLDDAVEALLVNDEAKQTYLTLAGTVASAYAAILPDPVASDFAPLCRLFAVLADMIRVLTPRADIGDVLASIERLLDSSIATDGYAIREPAVSYDPEVNPALVDLSQIDFEALALHFAHSRQRTEAEKLKGAVARKLTQLVSRNKTRVTYQERFQQLIDAYNAGSLNVEAFFAQLIAFAKELNAEEQRGLAAQLSEEELAVFDLLTTPAPDLTSDDLTAIAAVARDLLATLRREKLVLDWRKRQQSRAQVQLTIAGHLDHGLPPSYTQDFYDQKCAAIYQHIYDAYYGPGHSIYTARAA